MADNQDSKPRRRFLQALAIVPASTLATGTVLQTAQAATASAPAAGTAYAPTYFDKAEWAFIQAAVDHLIPEDDLGPGALVAGVPEFIDRQMEAPYGHGKLWYMQGPFHPAVDPTYGWQISLVPREVYRHGVADCQAYCQKQHGKAFVDLDKPTQEQVLKDMEAGKLQFANVPILKDGKPRTPYSLRHFHATRQLSKGVSAFLLARHMGTSVEMLEQYYGQVVTKGLAEQITGSKPVNIPMEGVDFPFD